MRCPPSLYSAFLCLVSIFVLDASAQTIATTMTVTANPASILFLGSTTVTATVTPASGPAGALEGMPIQFFDASGKPMTNLDGSGTASISYTYDPAGNNPASITARFPGGQSQYGQSFSPSSGTVVLNIVGPSAILEGPYTFLFKGLVPTDGAAIGNAAFALGILVADGNGNLTGEIDINSRFGPSFSPVTGTYVLQASGIGTMTLSSHLGVQHFDLWVPAQTGARVATLVPTDQNALFGTATLTQQPPSALAFPPQGIYSMEALGETAACVDCTSVGHSAGLVTAAGSASFAYAAAGIADGMGEQMEETIGTTLVNAAGASGHTLAYQGSYSSPDSLGRFTFQLALPTSAFPDQPANFAGYIVDATHIQVLSIDSHATDIIVLQTLRK